MLREYVLLDLGLLVRRTCICRIQGGIRSNRNINRDDHLGIKKINKITERDSIQGQTEGKGALRKRDL